MLILIIDKNFAEGGFSIMAGLSKMPNGKTIPAQEMLPSAEEYGRIAWCFCELENAEKKYQEVINPQSNNKGVLGEKELSPR